VRKIKLNSCLFILKTDEIKLLIISEIEGSGEFPGRRGCGVECEEGRGVIEKSLSPPHNYAPWAPTQNNKYRASQEKTKI
jgi:hypothetical protein